MTRDEVLTHVLKANSLPTLSNVASKLIEITGRPETDLDEITQLIAQDVSLSAKVLKVVNSAFYNFPNEVGSIQQAVAILGANAVRSLVLSFSFLRMEKARRDGGFNYHQFWEQSLATAVAAKMIVGMVPVGIDPEEIFTAGLLQNIGILILAQAYPQTYDEILAEADRSKTGPSLVELEDVKIGASHAFIGNAATRHWHFPANLSEPILFHHNPEAFTDKKPELAKVIRIAYLAGLVTGILYSSRPLDYADLFRRHAQKLLGLSSEDVDLVLENVNREVAQAADYFGLKIAGTPSIPEILQKANIELSLLNMSYEQMNRELVDAKFSLKKINAELLEKNRYLESIANLDGLTEVYNHRYFQENFDRELNRATRSGRPLSVLMADLDHFKMINDSYGHQAGDFVLREVCRVWREQLRDYDVLARYGGEEFAVLLPETTAEEAMAVAEKLRLSIAEHDFRDTNKKTYSVTASFGLATFESEKEEIGKDVLIQRADAAMYEAKKNGRNLVQCHRAKPGKWYQKIKL
ncbi:MAG: GGDEF domain-containing protein [Desulfobulbaceae bacterium]|nr:GGDEF domain-containing protein [Desulfobulbaceae bacterium]